MFYTCATLCGLYYTKPSTSVTPVRAKSPALPLCTCLIDLGYIGNCYLNIKKFWCKMNNFSEKKGKIDIIIVHTPSCISQSTDWFESVSSLWLVPDVTKVKWEMKSLLIDKKILFLWKGPFTIYLVFKWWGKKTHKVLSCFSVT